MKNRWFSAREIEYQQDQFSVEQSNFNDGELSNLKIRSRIDIHKTSEKFRVRSGLLADVASVTVGSLVSIKNKGSKDHKCDRYLVTKINDQYCEIKNITKSTIRSQSYELKLTKIYPVSSGKLPTLSQNMKWTVIIRQRM